MTDPVAYPVVYIRPRQPFGRQDEQVYRLLRDVLGEDVIIDHRADGAPILLSHPHLVLSISHCLSAVSVALAPEGTCVGLDVEDKRIQAGQLLGRYSSGDEQRLLQEHDIEPILLWSGKEAVYKAYSPAVIHFSHDIQLRGLDPDRRLMHYALMSSDRGRVQDNIEVCWLSGNEKNGKLDSDYDDSLVLTYHFSEGMEQARVISLPDSL